MSVTLNGTNGLTFNDGSTQNTGATGFGFKNRIINGAMMIDQRNAGATVTIPDSDSVYTLDRWRTYESTDGVITVNQDSTAPSNFTKSLKVTVTTADSSLSAAQTCFVQQIIEGFNIADFGWGTASSTPITVSFWVRSSVTGTFGGCVRNDSSRSYPFSYTINAANTWEQKSVTITGDTTGTWATTSGTGLRLYFSLGDGGNLSGTANAWTNTAATTVTGATNLLATLNATFFLTGVQLEKGSTATSFDYRPYGTELALCQRYYQILGEVDLSLGFACYSLSGDTAYTTYTYHVCMRTTPTGTYNFNTPSAAVSSVTFVLSPDSIRHTLTAGSTGRVASAGSTNAIRLSAEL